MRAQQSRAHEHATAVLGRVRTYTPKHYAKHWNHVCIIILPSTIYLFLVTQDSPGGPSMEKRVRALREALAECAERNEQAPELEKVRGGVWSLQFINLPKLSCQCRGV